MMHRGQTSRWYSTAQVQERIAQRTVLAITASGTLDDRLKCALERRFPWTVITELRKLDEAERTFANNVCLVLVEPDALADIAAVEPVLKRYHPLAAFAVLVENPSQEDLAKVAESPVISGIVPRYYSIDVQVSIVDLLLRGCEFFPRAPVKHKDTSLLTVNAVALNPAAQPPHRIPDELKVLTIRERQVLALVAQGLQNKSIADTLHRSEFTVKIHLHNIITKLGVHNRTEAAARYRALPLPDSPGADSGTSRP